MKGKEIKLKRLNDDLNRCFAYQRLRMSSIKRGIERLEQLNKEEKNLLEEIEKTKKEIEDEKLNGEETSGADASAPEPEQEVDLPPKEGMGKG